jgi:hypothetical protein
MNGQRRRVHSRRRRQGVWRGAQGRTAELCHQDTIPDRNENSSQPGRNTPTHQAQPTARSRARPPAHPRVLPPGQAHPYPNPTHKRCSVITNRAPSCWPHATQDTLAEIHMGSAAKQKPRSRGAQEQQSVALTQTPHKPHRPTQGHRGPTRTSGLPTQHEEHRAIGLPVGVVDPVPQLERAQVLGVSAQRWGAAYSRTHYTTANHTQLLVPQHRWPHRPLPTTKSIPPTPPSCGRRQTMQGAQAHRQGVRPTNHWCTQQATPCHPRYQPGHPTPPHATPRHATPRHPTPHST